MAGDEHQLQAALAEPIEETYHSILEARQWQGMMVVIKTCRNQDDPRTPVRFRGEVDALKTANDHVGSIATNSLADTVADSRVQRIILRRFSNLMPPSLQLHSDLSLA